jgi:hypothetical protein
MKTILALFFALVVVARMSSAEAAPQSAPAIPPVRSVMMFFPATEVQADFLKFIREDLPREGVTHLVLQIDYGYAYTSRPEMAGPHTTAEVKAIVAACREAKVELIPLLNCLGHQSWAETTHRLLTTYPEFDETPGLYPGNKDIYCRSYCPNHPGVHAVMFDLLAEIAAVFEARAVHVGLDEVFLIGEDVCPRCRGRDPAELLAQEIRTLRDFLHTRGLKMWMWGDRLIDGATTGIGKWEASMNRTHRAIDLIPKDVVICDWHYESTPPTAGYFALKGFDVILCSWNRPAIAVEQADHIVRLRAENAASPIGARVLGVMATVWEQPTKFLPVYRGLQAGEPPADKSAAASMQALFRRVRELETAPR